MFVYVSLRVSLNGTVPRNIAFLENTYSSYFKIIKLKLLNTIKYFFVFSLDCFFISMKEAYAAVLRIQTQRIRIHKIFQIQLKIQIRT